MGRRRKRRTPSRGRRTRGHHKDSGLVVLDEPSPAPCAVISNRRTDHFGISPQPSTTSHLEYGVSTVFPCGRRRRSIRTPTLPHGSTWPATVAQSSARVADDEVSMGVLLCGSLPSVSRAGVTPHGKTAEAPYSRLGSRRPSGWGIHPKGSQSSGILIRPLTTDTHSIGHSPLLSICRNLPPKRLEAALNWTVQGPTL